MNHHYRFHQRHTNRRAFLKTAVGLGGATVAMNVLSGCDRFTAGSRSIPSASAPTPLDAPDPTLSLSPTATLIPEPTPTGETPHARIVLIKTEDRTAGVKRALAMFDPELRDKQLLIKPNLNSSHPTPGSTHIDVLNALVQWSIQKGAGPIAVGDRSGMESTQRVIQKKGIDVLGEELGFQVIDFETLSADEWELLKFEGCNWSRGIPIAKPVLDADAVISTCCLKTHQYGGHFTMSLKNSVGIVAHSIPGDRYNYMNELHGSSRQRVMIAEINALYHPLLVVMDAIDAFSAEGPAVGPVVHPGVIIAGMDRVAIDAVGVAILRYFGTTHQVNSGRIFEQSQIARAVALGLGVDGPEKIELITDDTESEAFALEIRSILDQG